jgi:RNA polymerase sigma factor (sigma-70 family)
MAWARAGEPDSAVPAIADVAERSDREAVAASLDDPRAFVVVFERHFDAVFRYLRRRVGRERAEELAAETFTTAFAVRHRFDSNAWSARPWLFGIAVNLLRHHYRREERELRAYARNGVDPLDFEERALETLEAAAAAPYVAEALLELPSAEREALLLYAWADLSYAEIAEALEIPVGTVRSRLNRARRRVRELLAARGQYVEGTLDG